MNELNKKQKIVKTGPYLAVVLKVLSGPQISNEASTNGGSLSVSFKNDGNSFREIWLKGDINKIFDGLIEF